MGTTWQDVKYGLRRLRKTPGFTVIAILTLALGIGANTAIFSVVNGVLLRPLAYPQPDQLYLLQEVIPQMQKFYPSLPVNLPDFQIWQKRLHSFSGIAIAEAASADLTGAGEPEQVSGARVSANLFQVLGVKPVLGRDFLPEQDQTGHGFVVLLSHSFWRSHFHGNPSVVGSSITLDGVSYQVAGVLPASFHFPRRLGPLAVFPEDPVFFQPLNGPQRYEHDLLGEFDFAAIGRLRPGVKPPQALAELNVVQAQIARQANAKVDLLARMTPLEGVIVGSARRGLLFLLLAVGALLLIVCVNLANLMLARVPGRMKAAAIRTALGASRWRLARQLLTESLLLGLAGGALGVWLAQFGVSWLVHSAAVGIPRLDEVTIDGRVLAFAAAVSIFTGAFFGLVPAWRIAHAEPQESLRSGARSGSESRHTRRLRDGLVGLEVGLSTVLLILAGLLTASLVHVLRVDSGFSTGKVLAADVVLPPQSYAQTAARRQFYDRALAAMRSLPGVRQAGWTSRLPLAGEGSVSPISVPGEAQPLAALPPANYRAVSSGYFQAMGIALLAGRTFNESDRGRKVVVVSRSVAERLWPGQNPIGQTCVTDWGPAEPDKVIGVVGDIRTVKLDEPPVMMVYVPDWFGSAHLGTPRAASLVVRTAGNPLGSAAAVRQAIHQTDPEVPVVALRTMEQVVGSSVETRRFEMLLAGLFALVALLLASLGISGVVACSVEQRRHELGLRIALGAQLSDLRRMVLRQGMAPVLAGLGAGILLSLGAGRLLGNLLFGVGAFDPLTTAAVAAVVVTVALAACFVPARRAMRTDPITALRDE